LEETERGILLRKKDDNKLSYEETYKAIAQLDLFWPNITGWIRKKWVYYLFDM